MAVLTNTMMQGTAAFEEDTGFKIEKSLRFNQGDSPGLVRTFSGGNRRIWTLSCWVKRGDNARSQRLFSSGVDGSNYTHVDLTSSDYIFFQVVQGNSSVCQAKTSYIYHRDFSAWYHIVVAVDTLQATSTDRVKIFVNGKRRTLAFDTVPAQNLETETLESGSPHKFGQNGWSTDGQFNGYIADAYLIDGLALYPSAFGSFDSTGVWNPKAFALPEPNQNVTHSSTMVSSTGSWYSAAYDNTRAFNVQGMSVTGTSPDSATAACTWTPATPIAFTQSVESHNNACEVELTLTDGTTDTVLTITTAHATTTLYEGNHQIKSIKWTPIGSVYTDVQAIWVDGVLLVDGKTDLTTRNNVNNGTQWKDYISNAGSGNNMFNGSLVGGTWAAAGTPVTFDVTSIGGITYDGTMRAKLAKYGSSDTLEINGTDVTSNLTTGVNQWYDISSWFSGKTLNTAEWTLTSGGAYISWEMLEVDGHILVNGISDNSLHLKFNDTTLNRSLGKDTLNGAIADATGGLPIYNTTDATGDVKGSGYRADSSAGTTDGAGLIFAWPGDTTTGEVHASINTGSSAKTVTANGDPSVDTTQSRLYGTSVAFDRTGDYLSVDGGSDFNFGTGDYTIECWFMTTDNSVNQGIFVISDTSGGLATDESAHISAMIGNHLQVRPGDGTTKAIIDGKPTNNTWHHLAISRASGTFRAFYDGGLMYTKTGVTTSHADQYLAIGGYYSTSYLWKGNIQDFRIYKGTAKYTASFTAPNRNDFTVNNLTYSSTGGNDGPWTGSPSGFRSGGSDWNGGTDITDLESGDSYSTSGNNAMLQIDTSLLGNYDLTFTKTSGDNIHFYTSTSDSGGYGGASPSDTVTTSARLTNVGTSTHSYSRYVRMGGAGGGNAVFTVTGVIDMPDGVSIDPADLDVLTDTPTNYGTDTGAGGEVRGNYPTMNPYHGAAGVNTGTRDLSKGNLTYKHTDAQGYWRQLCTMAAPAGKWYWEFTCNDLYVPDDYYIGLVKDTHDPWSFSTEWLGKKSDEWSINQGGNTGHNGSFDVSGVIPTMAKGDVIQIAVDNSAGKLWFGKNGTWGTVSSNTGNPAAGTYPTHTNVTGPIIPATTFYKENGGGHYNFGQRAFKYTAPSGFKCICSANLPNTFSGDELNNPSKYFDVKTYTGTGGGHTINGLGFGPDLVWIKERDGTGGNYNFDTVRGAQKVLYTNLNGAEETEVTSLTAFNSDGFTLGTGVDVNADDQQMVSWNWDAGTSTVSNTDGDITSSVRANPTCGVSIIGFTSNDTDNLKVGHGLNDAPKLVILKNRDSTESWWVIHVGVHATGPWNDHSVFLDTDAAAVGTWGTVNNVAPTNTVVNLSNSTTTAPNDDTDDKIMYCFAPIAGFSSFGRYFGNGSADGPFIYTGFRPKWIMLKRADGTGNWKILDSKRDPINSATRILAADGNWDVDNSNDVLDILSNGFKIRINGSGANAQINGDGDEFMYSAFAEHPFKTARAR